MTGNGSKAWSSLLALLVATPILAGCLAGEDAGLAAHDEPLTLRPTSASGSDWTNPENAVTDDDAYAFTAKKEKTLTTPLEDSSFTGDITNVSLHVDQQQDGHVDDHWIFLLYSAGCDTGLSTGELIDAMGGFLEATSSRTVLTMPIDCPAGSWTWDRINAAVAYSYTYPADSTDGEWRVFHAWAEITFTNNVPVADAGPDANATESIVVTLDGTASYDPDGDRDPLTYNWTQVGGPTVSLTDPSTATPSFTAPTLSTNTPVPLEFELAVTDPNLDTATDRVIITVHNVNNPPVADAGDDQVVDEETDVTLDGSGSSDADGDTLTYSWTQTVGPAVTLSDAASVSPTFLAPEVAGQGSVDLAFRLVVDDGFNESQPDDVAVRVDNVNAAPTVSAGPDQTVDEETLVTLEAVGDDEDGDSLSYEWTQTAGTPVTLSAANNATTTFTAPTLSTNDDVVLTFSVTASDGQLVSAEDTVNVTVENINEAPVADAGADQTVDEEALVTLDATGSTDPDGDALTYAWTQTSGPSVTLSDATASRPTFTAPDLPTNDPVDLVLEVVVSDGALQSTPDAVRVTVENINQPPVAQAGPDVTVNETTTVTLDGTGSNDADEDDLAFNWTQTAGPSVDLQGADTAQPTFVAPTLSTNDPVTLTFSLVVHDGLEASDPDSVSVEVVNVNQAPTADAGPDASADESTAVTLDGTASSDPDGDPLTYSWSQTSGPVVTLSDATSAQPSFTAPEIPTNDPVDLVFRLVVSDGDAFSTADTVTVTILNVNQAPVLDPPADATVDEETLVTLAATASDPDSDPLTYLWTQTGGPTVSLSGETTDTLTFTAPTVPTSDDVNMTFDVAVDDGIAPAVVASVGVTVQNVNAPPVVSAGADQTVTEGTEVTLNGSVSDPDADPVTWTWSQTGGVDVTLTNASGLTPTFSAPAVDDATPLELTFRLNATDGSLSSHDDVVVNVENLNQAPVADPGSDQSVATGSLVTLDGTGSSDPDGDTLSYSWTQTGGPTVSLAAASTAFPSFTAPSAAATIVVTLVVTLVVTDSHGATSPAMSVVVTVEAPSDTSVEDPTTSPTPTTPVEPDEVVGAAGFPSSITVSPGESATVRVLGLDATGVPVDGTVADCTWQVPPEAGTLEPVDGDPCVQRFTAGGTPGLGHELVATGSVAEMGDVTVTVPVRIAVAAHVVAPDPDTPDDGSASCLATIPAQTGPGAIPISFASACGLHSLVVRSSDPLETETTVGIRVLADHPDLPEALTGSPAVLLDVDWTGPDETSVAVGEATVQFLVDPQWRSDQCPRGVCDVVLYHEDPDGWERLDATLVAFDAAGERYQATLSGFSVLAVGGVVPQQPAPPDDAASLSLSPWLAVGAVAALAVLVVATTLVLRSRRGTDGGPLAASGTRQGSLANLVREIRNEEIINFVNTAAHDMASPVSNLAVQLHLLTRDDGDVTEDDRQRLEVMGRSVEQLRMLVGDLRDAARLQAGELRLDLERVDIAAVVRESFETFQAKAGDADVDLRVDVSEPLLVQADPARIEQVLSNLLENAIRFTPAGGVIEVRGSVEQNDAVIRISDSGLGMDPDQVGTLFQPFTQAHGAEQSKGGSGLGLYISKGIVEAHGGRIVVERTEPGGGTVFRFKLPIDESAAGRVAGRHQAA